MSESEHCRCPTGHFDPASQFGVSVQVIAVHVLKARVQAIVPACQVKYFGTSTRGALFVVLLALSQGLLDFRQDTRPENANHIYWRSDMDDELLKELGVDKDKGVRLDAFRRVIRIGTYVIAEFQDTIIVGTAEEWDRFVSDILNTILPILKVKTDGTGQESHFYFLGGDAEAC